jgi:hypothetical protein
MTMTKLLKQVYKSYEGARKRTAFENGVAPGFKAKLYHYSVVAEGNAWRVQRSTVLVPTKRVQNNG